MKNKRLSIALAAAVLGTGVMIPVSFAQGNQAPGTSIEHREAKGGSMELHPVFPWDKPGPLSPVLHKGSVRGAGMIQQPLDEIDGHMENMIADGVMPGAVAFVARRGHVVKQEAYGFAYRYEDDQFTESSEPIKMEEDTIFDIASISKIFTTTAAMILYDQGSSNLMTKFLSIFLSSLPMVKKISLSGSFLPTHLVLLHGFPFIQKEAAAKTEWILC